MLAAMAHDTYRTRCRSFPSIFETHGRIRHCVRAAKELDSKSNGLCPQGLESPQRRIISDAVTRLLGLWQPLPQPRRRLRAQVPARAVRLCGPAVAGWAGPHALLVVVVVVVVVVLVVLVVLVVVVVVVVVVLVVAGQKQVRNRSETGQKQVRIGSETGQKRVRNRSETGQKQVRNGSETGQKQVRNGSETGQKQVRNGSETGQKQEQQQQQQ